MSSESSARTKRPVMQSAPGPKTIIDGRPTLYFAGTGYLLAFAIIHFCAPRLDPAKI